MCGVAGYVGKKKSKNIILDALKKLQYRGANSAGFACMAQDKIQSVKSAGAIDQLKKIAQYAQTDGSVGVGHTRWAGEYGLPITRSHPLISCAQDIAIVHNGKLDNSSLLKTKLLKQGHEFASDADAHVIPHLLEMYIDDYGLEAALKKVSNVLDGSYAVVGLALSYPNTLFSIRKTAPLGMLVADDGVRVASDFRAIGSKNNQGFFQPDHSFAIIKPDTISLYSFEGKKLPINIQNINIQTAVSEKNSFSQAYADYVHALRTLLAYILPDQYLSYDAQQLIALAQIGLEYGVFEPGQEHYVRKIVQAIEHLEDGTYGICVACGQPLASAALEKYHTLTTCSDCQVVGQEAA